MKQFCLVRRAGETRALVRLSASKRALISLDDTGDILEMSAVRANKLGWRIIRDFEQYRDELSAAALSCARAFGDDWQCVARFS